MGQQLLFKLDQNPNGRCLRCDDEGLFLGRDALLQRDREGNFEARPADELQKILGCAYGDDANWESRIRSVQLVASALNKGHLARAMMTAVLMRLPEPGSPISIADVDGVLAKASFNPGEPRDEHGRWTTEGSESAAPGTIHRDPRIQLADYGMSDASNDPVAEAVARAAARRGRAGLDTANNLATSERDSSWQTPGASLSNRILANDTADVSASPVVPKPNPRRVRVETLRHYIDTPQWAAFRDLITFSEKANAGSINNGVPYNDAFDPMTDPYPGRASGMFQIEGKTRQELVDDTGLTDFTPRTQDILAADLLYRYGILDDIMNGDIKAAIPKLAQIWSSIPKGPGAGDHSLNLVEGTNRLQPSMRFDDVVSYFNSRLQIYLAPPQQMQPIIPMPPTPPLDMQPPYIPQ